MKVAVLGSNGFIGNYLTVHLSNLGHEVVAVNRKTVNLLNYKKVKKFLTDQKIHTVINCAIAGGSKNGIDQQNYKDLQDNITVFLNFYNNSSLFEKYINVGSGAEFDLTVNNQSVKEEDILIRTPADSYGYSKNIISRLCLNKDKFYTLRLFGCFDSSESDFRLFKKFKSQNQIQIFDRHFDYLSVKDFLKVVDYYITNNNVPKDINCVYEKKMLLSNVLNEFAKHHCANSKIIITGTNCNNYTGNGQKLNSLNIDLLGLEKSLERYYA